MKYSNFLFSILCYSLLILSSCRENPARKGNHTATDTTSVRSEQRGSATVKDPNDSTNNAEKTNYTQKGTTKNVGQTRTNKGIGPVEQVDLPDSIDSDMAAQGKELYNNHCASCHRINESLTGPALGGVLKRRSPEFVMNMILNTDEMIEKEPIIKSLRGEYESDMVQVDVSQDEARAIVEYLRKYQ